MFIIRTRINDNESRSGDDKKCSGRRSEKIFMDLAYPSAYIDIDGLT